MRVTADVSILVNERRLYAEVDFPIVELAAALSQWCDSSDGYQPDFEFDSMSTPEPGWVWIRRADSGWRVGSSYQNYAELTEFTSDTICLAVSKLVERLVSVGLDSLGLDLAIWISGTGSPGQR